MTRNKFVLVGAFIAVVVFGSLAMVTMSLAYGNENANSNLNANANANSNLNTNGNTNTSVGADSWRGILTAMSGPTLPATLTLQVEATAYTVNVTSSTRIVRKYQGPSSLEEFVVGDDLRVWGTLTGTTIDATKLKNYSIQRVGGTFWGTILSIDSAASTFVLDARGRDDQTVVVRSTTKIFQGNRAGVFADLSTGQTVRVIGVWRKSAKQVLADRILIKLTSLNGTIGSVDCTARTFTLNVKGGKFEESSLVKRLTGGTTKIWTVTMTDATVLRDKELDPITCADLKANHKAHVRGLRTSASTLNALQVIDQGVKKTPKTITGVVSELDATAKTFVVTKSKAKTYGSTTYTVGTTAETIIVNSQGTLITFGDLANGHRVSVLGSLSDDQFTANLIIDRDLPGEDND